MSLALIAGQGDVPRMIAEHHKDAGNAPFIIVLKGFESEWVRGFDHEVCGIAEIGKVLTTLRAKGCETVSFIGNVKRPDFSSLKPDLKGVSLLPKIISAARRGDDALLNSIVAIFESEGFKVIGAHELLDGLTQPAGVLNSVAVSDFEKADIQEAYRIAGAIGDLDIGQGAVVCGGLVLAVEAQEGTDEMLRRIARLPVEIRGTEDERKGTLLKRPKPMQDKRVDMPTIGPSTVSKAAEAGLKVIAAVEHSALWVEVEKLKSLADAVGISLVSLRENGDWP